jgi:hypothetical protein
MNTPCIDSKDPELRYFRGAAYQKQGDTKHAILRSALLETRKVNAAAAFEVSTGRSLLQ